MRLVIVLYSIHSQPLELNEADFKKIQDFLCQRCTKTPTKDLIQTGGKIFHLFVLRIFVTDGRFGKKLVQIKSVNMII